MSVQGVGHWWRQSQLPDLLPDILRGELDRGLHCGHHAFGFREPIQARLTEPFMLSNEANLVHLHSHICRNELAVAPHASLSIDKVVGMANGADALGDVLSLLTEALVLLARGYRFLGDLFETCGGLWGAPRTPFCRGIARALQLPLSWLKPLLRFSGRLRRCPRCFGRPSPRMQWCY